jgi:hypothetical protein
MSEKSKGFRFVCVSCRAEVRTGEPALAGAEAEAESLDIEPGFWRANMAVGIAGWRVMPRVPLGGHGLHCPKCAALKPAPELEAAA